MGADEEKKKLGLSFQTQEGLTIWKSCTLDYVRIISAPLRACFPEMERRVRRKVANVNQVVQESRMQSRRRLQNEQPPSTLDPKQNLVWPQLVRSCALFARSRVQVLQCKSYWPRTSSTNQARWIRAVRVV